MRRESVVSESEDDRLEKKRLSAKESMQRTRSRRKQEAKKKGLVRLNLNDGYVKKETKEAVLNLIKKSETKCKG